MFTVSIKVQIEFTLSDLHTKTNEYNKEHINRSKDHLSFAS
jgi:hypothetical protein